MSRGKQRGLANGFPFAVPGWEVVRFSEYHFRINGIVDCWPGTGKWMPTMQMGTRKRGAERFFGEKELRHIVRQEEERLAKVKAEQARKLELAEARKALPAKEGVKSWEEFRRRFN